MFINEVKFICDESLNEVDRVVVKVKGVQTLPNRMKNKTIVNTCVC